MQVVKDQNITLSDSDFSWQELFSVVWAGKWIIVVSVFLTSVASLVYALSLPNIYRTEISLAPAAENSGTSVGGQLGGLAALAGVNLGGGSGSDKTVLALEIIKSRDFLGKFITKYDLFIPIVAASGWDKNNNELVIDADIYNPETKTWFIEPNPPFQLESKPSLHDTVTTFSKLFSVAKDKTTGMTKVSLQFYSPYMAKDWLALLVDEVNQEMRTRDLEESKLSIAYLNAQLLETNVSDMRTMLYSLIEEQTKTIMLANVREEYVFKTVDSAYVPEVKAGPKRLLILIFGIMFGLLLSVFILLIKYSFKKNSV